MWLAVCIPRFSICRCNQQQKGTYWRKNCIRTKYHTWFFFSYLLSLSSMVQPRLHGLYIVLDMKVIERWIHMSRRMYIGSMQILCHCKKDFVLHGDGDTWTPSSLGHWEVAVCSQNLQAPLWWRLEWLFTLDSLRQGSRDKVGRGGSWFNGKQGVAITMSKFKIILNPQFASDPMKRLPSEPPPLARGLTCVFKRFVSIFVELFSIESL